LVAGFSLVDMSSPLEWFLKNPHGQDGDVLKNSNKKVLDPVTRIEDFKVLLVRHFVVTNMAFYKRFICRLSTSFPANTGPLTYKEIIKMRMILCPANELNCELGHVPGPKKT